MQNGAMKAWLDSSYLAGANQSYIEQLYEDFLTDPGSVDDSWRSIFQQLPTTGVKPDQLHSQRVSISVAWRRIPLVITPLSMILILMPSKLRYCS